jgi:rhamnose utilization protein RhaD (predicted bifunctional aldolase and dehydrogenase)
MKESKLLNDFLEYSKKIGVNKAYIQGGGGNLSIKLNSQWMAIKSSGHLLMDMTSTTGFCLVNFDKTKQYLEKPDKDETTFYNHINEFSKNPDDRPSMETGFHAICGRSVIHTHSVYVNVLTCAKEGAEITKKLFPSSLWIGYETPGRDITLQIKAFLVEKPRSIIFLENHGIIIFSEVMKDAYEIHEAVNQRIQKSLNLDQYPFEVTRNIPDIERMKENVLFPDQVVYTLAGNEILATTAAIETLAAYGYIFETMTKIGLTPQFITAEKSRVLRHMESEKYRQRLIKK